MTTDDSRPSFEELWRRLAPHVRAAVARHPSRDAALGADDIAQEVRIRVWTVYDGDRNARLGTSYYYRVVNSAIIDCLRAHRGTLSHSRRAGDDEPDGIVEHIDSDESGPDAAHEDELRRRRLRTAIARLPAARRRAVKLFLQGFTVTEIAELLGCDHDRAHNLTYRGVGALKRTMKDEQD